MWAWAVRAGEELRREGDCGCAGGPWSARAARGPVVLLPVPMLRLREKLDERLVRVGVPVPAPSRKATRPSAAPLAALDRRLVDGGGVGREVWGLAASGLASLSEAARWTVTTLDDEREVLRELRRWACAGPAGSCRLL